MFRIASIVALTLIASGVLMSFKSKAKDLDDRLGI
jgi:hypothetical protein